LDLALFVLQVALAAVFVAAASAKSLRPDRTREALTGFGVPDRLAPLLVPALPLAELAVGVMLVPFVQPRAGAIASLVLLAAFTTAIAHNLARGRAMDCNCFGALRARPIGPLTLVRNAALMAAAGCIAWLGPGAVSLGVTAWLRSLPAIDLVLLASVGLILTVMLAGGAYIVHILHGHARRLDALREIEGRLVNVPPARGLPVGAFAPSFTLPLAGGGETSLESLLAPRKPLILFFVHPDCGPCAMLLPRVVAWRATHEQRLGIALLTTTSDRGTRPPEYEVLDTIVEENRSVSKGYQVSSMPSAVLIRPDGTIGSPIAIGEAAIGNLIEWATHR
jgi:hypothetical protein